MKRYQIILGLAVALGGGSVSASTLTASQDAEVRLFDADGNYGSLTTITARRDDVTSKVYLQFDASGLGVVENVDSFKLISLAQYGRGAHFYLIQGEGDDDWGGRTITWNNAPANDVASNYGFLTNGACTALLLGASTIVSAGEETGFVWDSAAAKNALVSALNSDNRKVTIAIGRNGDRYAQFASRENGTYHAAQLELNVDADTKLTDAEFFAVVNLDRSGLEDTKTAWNSGDLVGAKHFLCEHFRNRGSGFWWNEVYTVPDESDGEAALSTYQQIVDQTGSFAPEYWLESGDFNWALADYRIRRMYFFTALGSAYRYSGDEAITQVWVELFRSWIDQTKDVAPNRLEMGIRLRTGWGDAFSSFLSSPSLSDADLFLFIKSYYEQALHLRENHSDTSNWLTFEMAGLYSTAVLFPELAQAGSWRDYVVNVVTNDLTQGWLPDGVTIELTPGYGTFFSNYLLISDLADETGYGQGAVTNIAAQTERLYEVYLGLMAPDWKAPAFNDNTPVNVSDFFQSATNRFSDRQDFVWAASKGSKGTAPDYLGASFPYAGYLALRSGWETDANYVCFDAGPVGYRHAHQDKLSVAMWAYGRQVLYDPGRQNYDESDPHQNYCMDTFSHSTGLVDGRPQRRKWYQNPNPSVQYPYSLAPDFDVELSDGAGWGSGVYADSYGLTGGSVANDAYPYLDGSNFNDGWVKPAGQYRQVAYLQPDIFVVQDWFVPNDSSSHSYEIRWQLDSVSISTNGNCIETSDGGLPNLAVIPLREAGLSVSTVSAENSPDIMGWKVLADEVPATTLRHVRSGTGKQSFVTLLFPLRSGGSFAGADVSESNGVITLSLEDGRIFEITPAANEDGRLQVSLSPQSDADADGIPDWWEQEYFGGSTNAVADALAANAINTIREAYIAGLSPTDSSEQFSVAGQLQSNQMVLSWNAVTDRVYTVCWSTNLLEGFTEILMPQMTSIYTGMMNDAEGFYKLKVEMIP